MGKKKPKISSSSKDKKKKTNNNKVISNSIIVKKKKTPEFFRFNINSHFFYDFNDSKFLFSSLSNPNIVIPNYNDIEFLSNKILELDRIVNINKTQYISLSKDIFNSIAKFHSEKFQPNDIEIFIMNEIAKNKDRSKISCRNLAELYTNTTGKIIHKSQINNIMRKRLGLHYIKTCVKSSKLHSKESKFLSFGFIRTIIKAIKLGFKILFQDESIILCSNNNFRCWRFINGNIYYGNNLRNKKNLLLLIGENEIIHYKITEKNTNQDVFFEFCQECLSSLKKKGYEKYIIILDNLSSHKTKKLLNFYQSNNMNIVFNVGYCSYFNSAELSFRSLKKHLYRKIFENINEVEKEVVSFLSDSSFRKTLLANYKETLEQYKMFYEQNNNLTFNNFDD